MANGHTFLPRDCLARMPCYSVLDSFSPNLPSFRKAKGALNTAVGKPNGRPEDACVAVVNTAMPLATGKLYLDMLEHPEVARDKANTLVCRWGIIL